MSYAKPNDPRRPSKSELMHLRVRREIGCRTPFIETPDPGFTCCEAGDLLNPTPTLNQRIDLIFLRGGLGVANTSLIGTEQADRPGSGLWPSDHAGVAAPLRLPSPQANKQ